MVARYPRGVQRGLSGVVVLGLIALSLIVWHQRQAAEACRTTVDFGGVTYTRATTTEEVISGKDLGDVTMHCGSYERPISLSRTPGLDPSLAVASPISGYVLYLAPGVTPQDLPDTFGTVRIDS